MKKIFMLLSCLMLLVGCKSDIDDKTAGSIPQEITVETEYFHVQVPSSWEGLYEYQIYDEDINGYALIFYEKESYETMGAGYLMAISLYHESEDYTYLPSYDVLGTLEVEDDIYNVLVEYPTDVQFEEQNADKYFKLSNGMESILDTITPNEGYTYKEITN